DERFGLQNRHDLLSKRETAETDPKVNAGQTRVVHRCDEVVPRRPVARPVDDHRLLEIEVAASIDVVPAELVPGVAGGEEKPAATAAVREVLEDTWTVTTGGGIRSGGPGQLARVVQIRVGRATAMIPSDDADLHVVPQVEAFATKHGLALRSRQSLRLHLEACRRRANDRRVGHLGHRAGVVGVIEVAVASHVVVGLMLERPEDFLVDILVETNRCVRVGETRLTPIEIVRIEASEGAVEVNVETADIDNPVSDSNPSDLGLIGRRSTTARNAEWTH